MQEHIDAEDARAFILSKGFIGEDGWEGFVDNYGVRDSYPTVLVRNWVE